MEVLLPFAQTDQEGRGQVVAIPNGRSLLPVQALQDWIAEAGITSGPLFRSINQAGGLCRKTLGHLTIAAIINHDAGLAGLDVAEISGNSPRAWFVTSAAERNAGINRIMGQARHVDPRTTRKYIRRAQRYKDHAGAGFL